VDFRHGGEFLRGALGVAASNYDLRGGVLASDTADESARLAVRFRGDAAGVYNDDIGDSRISGGRESAVAQVGRDGLAIGTAGAAAKVFDVVFCHVV
jgi:hypothetical protein